MKHTSLKELEVIVNVTNNNKGKELLLPMKPDNLKTEINMLFSDKKDTYEIEFISSNMKYDHVFSKGIDNNIFIYNEKLLKLRELADVFTIRSLLDYLKIDCGTDTNIDDLISYLEDGKYKIYNSLEDVISEMIYNDGMLLYKLTEFVNQYGYKELPYEGFIKINNNKENI